MIEAEVQNPLVIDVLVQDQFFPHFRGREKTNLYYKSIQKLPAYEQLLRTKQ